MIQLLYPIEPEQVVYGDGSTPRGHFRYPSAHGHCFFCGNKLKGRRRHYCSNECGENYYNHFNWTGLREIILERDNYQCVKCDGLDYLEVDHIIAVVNGGNYFDKKNLQTLCRVCHGIKTSEDLKEKNLRERRNRVKIKIIEFL